MFVGSTCTRQYTDFHWGSRLAALHLYCVGCVWNHHLQSYKTGSCVTSSEWVVVQCYTHHPWSYVLSTVNVYSWSVVITICDHIRCVISSECDSYSHSVLMIFIMRKMFDGGLGVVGVAWVALASTKCSTNLPQKLLTILTPIFIFSLNTFPWSRVLLLSVFNGHWNSQTSLPHSFICFLLHCLRLQDHDVRCNWRCASVC